MKYVNEVMINAPDGYTCLIPNEFENTFHSEYWDINVLFWKEIFSVKNIKKTIECAEIRYKHSDFVPLKIQVILSDTKQYYKNLQKALKFKFTPNTRKQDFFACLETLEMFCELYTLCWTLPYKLSIAEGFIHNKDSSDFLYEYCLTPNCNPYLDFIKLSIIPELIKMNPDILWIEGRPNIAIFSLVKLLKENLSHVYVVLCDPKAEYYSLFKIKKLLVKNIILFKLFDCILFSNNIHNRKKISDAIEHNYQFNDVTGCIYKIEEKIIYKDPVPNIKDEEADFHKINLKLFKNQCCYWNQCSFCGINQKYDKTTKNIQWNVPQAINILKKRQENSNKYMWLIDEAIPPTILKKLMLEYKKNDLNFIWHFRTRIEPELLDKELIDLITENGVKSIILGFESASKRILSLMNKSLYDDYLIIAEKIVAQYTNRGIHIHFPVLIGFPTETDAEREKSFKFVEYLSERYSLFSYNINILELDISSTLFKCWESYDIKHVRFPCSPKYFLGNCIEWDCDTELLNQQRTIQMKKQFPWYPTECYLSINTFYNLWEQKKGLFCKESTPDIFSQSFALNSIYILNNNVIMFKLVTDEYCIYHYDTHNFICGGEIIEYIYNAFSYPICLKEIINRFHYFDKEILINFLSDLLNLKFIIQK